MSTSTRRRRVEGRRGVTADARALHLQRTDFTRVKRQRSRTRVSRSHRPRF